MSTHAAVITEARDWLVASAALRVCTTAAGRQRDR
ncbi:hypothetical protein BKA19_3849 [Blastococcus saxobsidens]|uniref:Uncharacterized protein n=1 Tax=Blastococcus saxobsidens TaxID=138336 RepID=A0A4Q7YD04_9ACTN|nr:hypothetical protein BKA19_3849 [Blastococcus saxobsidens]